jgi:RNA polymerase-binding transcription factor DksA
VAKAAPKKAVVKPVVKAVVKAVPAKVEAKKVDTKPVAVKPVVPAVPKSPEKTRYSDSELVEFKDIIVRKLNSAREELQLLTETLSNPNSNGTDDTAGTFKVLEDGSATLEKEHVNQLAARQRKFIDQLEAALVRIENKTYGVCRETGRLIPKERLRAVPHTTLSMEAKLKQN